MVPVPLPALVRSIQSTNTVVVYVLLIGLTKSLDSKDLALTIFYNISKAFNSLNFEILLDKLQYYSIKGTALVI